MPNLVVVGQMARAYEGDPPEKNESSCTAFQGHSRSPEPPWIDQLHMTSY